MRSRMGAGIPAGLTAVGASVGSFADRHSTDTYSIRLMRNGDWKGEDGMGVADHHTWRHNARHGIMLAVRRQKSAMACDFA